MTMTLMHLWKFHSLALLAGCVWDWIMGDPCWLPHPVRWMGHMISGLENRLRKRFKGNLLLGGADPCSMYVLFLDIGSCRAVWRHGDMSDFA